jgi:hypothetical protein
MLPSLARVLPIPHLFMAVSVVACVVMVVAMLGPRTGAAAELDAPRAISAEGDLGVDASAR